MPKYNVGVGDAFPVDSPPERQSERQPERPESDRESWRSCESGYRRHGGPRGIAFRVAVLLFLIWGALAIFNGHGPRGLLIAAGILVAIGIFQWMFSSRASRDGWREERRRRHEERRRRWGER